MGITQFMKNKSISDSRSVENNLDKRFQSVVFNQHRQIREPHTFIVDSSSSCETHLCGVHNGKDFVRQFSKIYDRKYTILANSHSLQLHFKKI